jgi:predicted esterase
MPESILRLPVEGHGDALLVIPDGEQPRPLLIAAGGAGDRPDWQCRAWQAIVAGRAFVLCVRGLPLNPGAAESQQQYYFKNHFDLEREILAALRSAEAVLGARLDATEVLYAGFSQGATMGALVVMRHPKRFPRAVLIEGGVYDWSDSAAQSYRRAGGQRVLFACGQPSCLVRARRSSDALEHAGISARAVFGAGGHTYEAGVGAELRAQFDWLVEGAPRWSPKAGSPVDR